MDHSGSSGSFLVTTGGVTCYSIGYVENKPYDSGFDNCVVRDSLWGVSYKTNTSQTGSTSSYWSADYKGRTECEMELRGQSSGTYVCGSAAQCSTTTYTWGYDTTPTYYVSHLDFTPYLIIDRLTRLQLIFNPQAASLSLVEEHDLPSRITITETLVSTETKYMMKSTGGLHDSEHEQIVWIA